MKFSIIPWFFRRSYELEEQPRRSTVGILVRSMHRHERQLAERRDNLEVEIKRLNEELRQTNVAHATYLASLKALAQDPALTAEERTMASYEVKIDEAMIAAIIEKETAPNHFIKSGVTLADVVTEDAVKVVAEMAAKVPPEIASRAAQVERAMMQTIRGES